MISRILRKRKVRSIIRDEYDNNNAKITEAKQKIEARNRIRFGLASEKTDERPKE